MSHDMNQISTIQIRKKVKKKKRRDLMNAWQQYHHRCHQKVLLL